MFGIISSIPGLLFAPTAQQAQNLILGLPWWAWALALLVIVILLWLLFNQPKEEAKPVVEEKVEAKVEEKVETLEAVEKLAEPEVEPVQSSSPFVMEDVPSLDDLTIIEGIGPKISTILREARMDSFAKLANASPAAISQILKAAGIQLFDASTWPEQASLISQARWDELAALQRRLTAGRRE